MSIKDQCPHCGAEIVMENMGHSYYACGTSSHGTQSDYCSERTAHATTKAESASHASTATILGFECQRLQAEVNDLKKRLSAFTDL